jgi:uncharacterized protein (DUF305 family)
MEPKPIPSGPDFDRMWLMDMIGHHQGAIDMSVLALDAGLDKPLDSLAQHIKDEQLAEQQEFRDSIAVWYGASAGAEASEAFARLRQRGGT